MSNFFEGPFLCREHLIETLDPKEFEYHLKKYHVVFGSNGTCSFCKKSGLFFANVKYLGLPHLWELVCQDCSKKTGKEANAFTDPLIPFGIKQNKN